MFSRYYHDRALATVLNVPEESVGEPTEVQNGSSLRWVFYEFNNQRYAVGYDVDDIVINTLDENKATTSNLFSGSIEEFEAKYKVQIVEYFNDTRSAI